MNQQIREELETVSSKLSALLSELETIKDGEEEKIDKMPENLEGSEQYMTLYDGLCSLEEGCSYIKECMSDINELL